MKISLVLVCHHSSRVLPRCVGSFRSEADAAGVEAEIVAVDHSEDAAEIDRVRSLGVDRLLERPNRGYAAGLNVGTGEASGQVLLLANPDISFFPGSVGALLAGIEGGYDVVGPQLVWDDEGKVLLPAAEDPAPRAELARALRLRWPRLWSANLSRMLDEAWRLWSAESTVQVRGLRGALLALSREALSRFGPFDEGYFLYYEETEWLWRARLRGARLGLAADARVEHRWGHATGKSQGAAEHEERSRHRFVARNYGGVWRRLLRASEGGRRQPPIALQRLDHSATVPNGPADMWLASPFPHLMPALGSLRTETMPTAFLDFCRTWRWVVAAASRREDRWRIDGAWTWGP